MATTEEPETLDSPESGLAPGTVLDEKFRIERLLGMGGMGAVYAIKHELTQHRRAMKLLHPQFAQQKTVVERFLREASAAGHIGNEHIIETFDAGWLNSGEPYLVMELLDGMPLEDRLEECADGMTWAEALEIFLQLCDGVQAAHDAGIVHRDLKPENVFLGRGGGSWKVKILDFGVSKFDEKLATKLTTGGSFVGTPAYMSPEQFESGADIDSRSDIYSLGIILYELLAGEHPYPATSMAQLARMILSSELRPLLESRADLPPAIDDLLAKVVTRTPEERIATARGLATALRELDATTEESLDLSKTAAVLTREAPTVPREKVRSPVSDLKNTEILEKDPESGEAAPSKTLQSAQDALPESEAVPESAAPAESISTSVGATTQAQPAEPAKNRTLTMVAGAVVLAGVAYFVGTRGGQSDTPPAASAPLTTPAGNATDQAEPLTPAPTNTGTGLAPAPTSTANTPPTVAASAPSAPTGKPAAPKLAPPPSQNPAPTPSTPGPLPKRGTNDEFGG